MYERILRQMRKAVRSGRVLFTPHARAALRDDGFKAAVVVITVYRLGVEDYE
jgi:hypothetical protein